MTATETVLARARAARTDPAAAEAAVLEAVRLAPDDLAVREAAYKFYFYNARLAEALPHGEACLALAGRALGLAAEVARVAPTDAAFDTLDKAPRLYLQCLVALGYLEARLGRSEAALVTFGHVVRLDPLDRFGAARLAAVVARGGVDPDDEDGQDG